MIVYDYFIENKQPLGGEGEEVEIDESKFGKRKYHRGHRVEGQWALVASKEAIEPFLK